MWIVISLLVILVAVYIHYSVLKFKQFKKENEMMESYMENMKEFYEGIHERIEATRRYRHDLAKHIQTLERILNKRGDVSVINQYAEEKIEEFHELRSNNYCNDEVLNAILSLKKEECEKKNIPLKITIDNCYFYGIEEIDKTGLILNLLDNAIEASERLPIDADKQIDFEMYCTDNNIFIEIKNHILKGKKVSFVTQKKVKEEHGLGIKIIESIVNKYNGTRQLYQNNENWTLVDKIILEAKEY